MKRLLFGLVIFAVAGIVIWVAISRRSSVFPDQMDARNATNSQNQPVSAAQKNHQSSETNAVPTTMSPKGTPTVTSADKPHNIEEWMEREYGHPIEFYGKAAEEDETPVADATVAFDWANAKGQGLHASATSDSSGSFFITDIKGKNLGVTVSKKGYYPRTSSFEYADPSHGLYSPDRSNPVVFHLHKKGRGVELITSRRGMSPDFPIHIPRDGTPVKIDLLNRTEGGAGQLIISESKPEFKDWKKATSWAFKLEIPDGGLIEENDEFPFEPPQDGYRPVVEFQFQKGDSDWAENLKKDYYIKFGSPAVYGRLHFETSIMMGGALLTYAINPDGSRNLEPK